MFTGLIEAIGKVVKCDARKLWIQSPFGSVRSGESLCVDGVCLTVTRRSGRVLCFDIGPETARLTTLGGLRPGSSLNLERPLRVGDPLGGHWVAGHVEAVARIESVRRAGPNRWITLALPKRLRRYAAPKGSLSVDGISLTVASIKKGRVRLMIIPYTLSHTTLGAKRRGDWVNVETDILAKYAASTSLRGVICPADRRGQRRRHCDVGVRQRFSGGSNPLIASGGSPRRWRSPRRPPWRSSR